MLHAGRLLSPKFFAALLRSGLSGVGCIGRSSSTLRSRPEVFKGDRTMYVHIMSSERVPWCGLRASNETGQRWLACVASPITSTPCVFCFILIYTHPHPWYCTVHGTQTTYIRPDEGTRRGETTTSAHGHIHKQAQNHAWVFLAHRPCRGCLGGGTFCHQVGVNGLGPFLSCLQPRLFWRRNSLGDFCMA